MNPVLRTTNYLQVSKTMATFNNKQREQIMAELSAALAADAEIEIVGSEEQITASLNKHQLFLAPEDIFASEIVNQAFVSEDGVDLRSPLAIRNVETAGKLVNFLDSDHVLAMLHSQDRNIIEQMAPHIPDRDQVFLRGIFARLERENPPPEQPANASAAERERIIEQFVTRYTKTERRRQLGGIPVSSAVAVSTQYALRLMCIVRLARDFTMQQQDLREFWFKGAREKQPNLSARQFERLVDVNFNDFPPVRGVSGLFSKIKDWVVKLFRHPLKALRDVLVVIGKSLQLAMLPFDWIEKKLGSSWFNILVGGPIAAVVAKFLFETGRMFVEGSVSAFREQDLSLFAANEIAKAGIILTFIGSVMTAIPCGFCQAFGPLIAVAGAALTAIGKAWLYLHSYTRQQRLIREGLFAAPLPMPLSPKAKENRPKTTTERVSSSGSGGGVLAVLALLVALKAGGA